MVAHHIADEHHVGANLGENGCRVVAVVCFATTDGLIDTGIGGVLRNFVILHEVHHVDGAVILWGSRGEGQRVVLIYTSVFVWEFRCVVHLCLPLGRA